MALRPLQNALAQSGIAAFQLSTPFKSDADAVLAGFQRTRAELERQVRSGDLTLKTARERALAAARQLREHLMQVSEQYSPVPPVFIDRLVTVSDARRRAKENQSLEGLQREGNRLLRQLLVEQQLAARTAEFEARVFVRPLHGGQPVATLDGLIAFHQNATQSGDDSAREWARRQLESFRARASEAKDLQRIDDATARPDHLNDRIVQRYLSTLRDQPAEILEQFLRQSIESHDANACAAAFLLARECPGGLNVRWVRETLDSLVNFPESALDYLRLWETEARRNDAQAARGTAEFTATIAEAEARFPDFTPPTAQEIARRDQMRARPVADDGEPIGLNLARRGRMLDDPPAPTPQNPTPEAAE